MGIVRRMERGNSVGREIRGKVRCSLEELLWGFLSMQLNLAAGTRGIVFLGREAARGEKGEKAEDRGK